MKIGMILDQEFPVDVRVENEALSLVDSGHQVFLLCVDSLAKTSEFEEYNGINIIRLKKPKKWISRGRALINTVLDYYTSYWAKEISSFVKKNDIKVLHVHDLYMLGAAFRANKKCNIPIVADLHENYAEGLKYYQFANTFPGNMLISIKKWEKKEIEWCQKADHVVTVIDEAVDRYSNLGVARDNISVVANFVNADTFLNSSEDLKILNRFSNKFTATYIGGFDLHRGLESIVQAVPNIIKSVPNFQLVLVGQGKNSDDLKKLAQSLKVDSQISFEGFQSPDKVPSYIKASNICLIPHLKTIHTDNTIPHKLFHYMLLGKPIVASNCNPIKRIVEETKTGLIYENGNPAQFARQIIQLYKTKEMAVQMGENGKKAIREKYNWPATSKNLIKLYEYFESKTLLLKNVN